MHFGRPQIDIVLKYAGYELTVRGWGRETNWNSIPYSRCLPVDDDDEVQKIASLFVIADERRSQKILSRF